MHYEFDLEMDRVSSHDRPYFTPWEKDSYLNKAIFKFLKDRYGYDNRIKRGFETDQARISQLSSLHIKSPELQPPVRPEQLRDGYYELRLNSLGEDINGQFFRYLYLTDITVLARKGACTKYIGASLKQTDDMDTVYNVASWKWRRCPVQLGRSNFIHPHPDGNPGILDENDFNAKLIHRNRYNNDELSSIFFYTYNLDKEVEFEIEEAYVSYIKYPNKVFIGGYDTLDGLYKSTSNPVNCDIDDAFHDEIVRLAVQYARQDVQDVAGVQISAQKTLEDRV